MHIVTVLVVAIIILIGIRLPPRATLIIIIIIMTRVDQLERGPQLPITLILPLSKVLEVLSIVYIRSNIIVAILNIDIIVIL